MLNKGIVLILLLGTSIDFISCSSNISENPKEIKVGIIEQVIGTKNELEEFSGFLGNYFDSSFYAQYRPKIDDYYFFNWENNTIHGSFTPSDSIRLMFKKRASLWKLDEVIKYKHENFFRLGIVKNGKKIAHILVLKKGGTLFKFSLNSGLNDLKIISSLQEIKFYNTSFVYKMTDSIMIYFI